MEVGLNSTTLGTGALDRLMLRYRVHFVVLPARDIFGMVGRCGGGYNSQWTDWSEEGRKKRELIMQEFEQGLDAICGHYSRLERSILAEGVRNPVTVTCGHPRKRTMQHLPPEMRSLSPNRLLLLETTVGGSRLHICQKYDMKIACIVNDWTGRFAHEPEIKNESDARLCYLDQPQSVAFHPNWGFVEQFDQKKVGYHLGDEWSEDRIMPLRAPLWIRIMNRHGYRVENLPRIVLDVLKQAGVNQDDVSAGPTK